MVAAFNEKGMVTITIFHKSEVLKSLSDWRHDYSNNTLKSRYFDLKASWKRLIKKERDWQVINGINP